VKKIIFGIAVLLLSTLIYAESILYKKTLKKQETIVTLNLERVSYGYKVEMRENDYETKIFICDEFFDVKEWFYKNQNENTDIKAKNKGIKS